MYKVAESTRNQFYKKFGKTENTVNNDVKIIKEWIFTQKHLPETMEDNRIKNFLNLNKFNIEKTKEKIDMYYSIRSIIPEMFEKSNPKLDSIKEVFETTYLLTLPTVIDGTSRVYISKQKNHNTLKATEWASLWLDTFEVRLYEDFMMDDIIIVDAENFSVEDIKKLNPTIVSQFFGVYEKVYSLRLSKLIFINCQPYVTILAEVLKSVLPKRVYDSVEIHQNADILKEILPMEILPKDYGGEGLTLQELTDMLQNMLSAYQDRFDILDNL